MALDPHALKPSELARLMNATPLGETMSRQRIYRQRDRGGLRVGDGETFDLIRYTAWLFLEWKERRTRNHPADGENEHGT